MYVIHTHIISITHHTDPMTCFDHKNDLIWTCSQHMHVYNIHNHGPGYVPQFTEREKEKKSERENKASSSFDLSLSLSCVNMLHSIHDAPHTLLNTITFVLSHVDRLMKHRFVSPLSVSLSLSLSRSLSFSLVLSVSRHLSLSRTHTHTHIHNKPSLSLSLSHTYSLSLSLTHTHKTHTHIPHKEPSPTPNPSDKYGSHNNSKKKINDSHK